MPEGQLTGHDDDDRQAQVRVTYLALPATTIGGDSLDVPVRWGDLEVNVAFSRPAGAEPSRGLALRVTATAAVNPAPEDLEALRRLANGSGLPESVSGYGSEVSLEIATCMRHVVELARWRSNAALSNNPFEYQGAEFSVDDGANWKDLPLKGRATLRKPGGLRFDPDSAESIAELAALRAEEPVAHHLLREALDIAAAHPRSSIVIGVTALEAGFKQLVQALVPASAWLMQKMPSPPVKTMLSDYLPTLPVVLRIDGHVHPPPKYARRLVAQAVEERNRVAHTGAQTMTSESLAETLECVRDLLYLFDYYAGHEWALELISPEFRSALGE